MRAEPLVWTVVGDEGLSVEERRLLLVDDKVKRHFSGWRERKTVFLCGMLVLLVEASALLRGSMDESLEGGRDRVRAEERGYVETTRGHWDKKVNKKERGQLHSLTLLNTLKSAVRHGLAVSPTRCTIKCQPELTAPKPVALSVSSVR